MTIFVYSEAYVPNDEYADITTTQVFKSLDEAVNYLKTALTLILTIQTIVANGLLQCRLMYIATWYIKMRNKSLWQSRNTKFNCLTF